MSNVKWIKINVDMFDDEKIKIIQSMPDGDSLLVVWVRLITLAGKTNDRGYVYIAENLPYTEEMLSVIMNKPLNTIRLSLEMFTKLNMIEIDEKGIYLLNFEKYQSLDKLEQMRENTRLRVAKHRENKKNKDKEALLEQKEEVKNICNVTRNVTVTQCNALDIDIDKDIDIELEKENKQKKKKKVYGEYKHIKLTDEEYQKLVNEYSSSITDACITYLDEYIEMKGTKYRSHYLAIRKWVVDAVKTKNKGYIKTNTSIKTEVAPAWLDKDVPEQNSEQTSQEIQDLLDSLKMVN